MATFGSATYELRTDSKDMYKGLDKARKGGKSRSAKIGKALAIGIGGALTAGLATRRLRHSGHRQDHQGHPAGRGRTAPDDRARAHRC